jgi:hypothetical protein
MANEEPIDDRNNGMLIALAALVVTMHKQGVMNAVPYIQIVDALAVGAQKEGFQRSAVELAALRERILHRVGIETTPRH